MQIVCPETINGIGSFDYVCCEILGEKAFSEAAKTCVVDADKSLISVYEK
jgi:hypothetical protein